MKRIHNWLVMKHLERNRRRDVRAMLRCFDKIMYSKGDD